MRYYIIAGEASGDLHGSNLVRALQLEDAQADFRAWGGDLMQAAGAKLVKHYRDLAFMGFWEVAKNIRTIVRNLDFCKKDALAYQPDVLILVDYPGFNLRIAAWAKTQGIRVFYYISPQIWAWKAGRIKQIERDVERMFVILPFETAFYRKYGVEVDFVGHPLLDVIPEQKAVAKSEKPIIALLPGSRQQEIKRMLVPMLSVVDDFPAYQFVIAGAPGISPEFYTSFLTKNNIQIVYNQTYTLLEKAQAALVTSGTATLEAALFGVPQVVCYRGNGLSYRIAKRLIKVKFIALVNLIMDREIVKELIQRELTTSNLRSELTDILTEETQQRMTEDYRHLRLKLGNRGVARRLASLIIAYLK